MVASQMVLKRHSDRILIELYDTLFGNAEELAAILRIAGSECGTLIEAGCGTGRVLEGFAARGWKCIGFDREPRMIEIARNKIDSLVSRGDILAGTVDLRVGDMTEDWSARGIDLAVIAYNTMLMCSGGESIEATFREAGRALRVGGRLIVSIIAMSDGIERVIYHHASKIKDNCVFVMRSAFRRLDSGTIVRSYYVDELNQDGNVRSYFAEWAAVDISATQLVAIGERQGLKLARSHRGYAGAQFSVRDEQPLKYVLEFEKTTRERGVVV